MRKEDKEERDVLSLLLRGAKGREESALEALSHLQRSRGGAAFAWSMIMGAAVSSGIIEGAGDALFRSILSAIRAISTLTETEKPEEKYFDKLHAALQDIYTNSASTNLFHIMWDALTAAVNATVARDALRKKVAEQLFELNGLREEIRRKGMTTDETTKRLELCHSTLAEIEKQKRIADDDLTSARAQIARLSEALSKSQFAGETERRAAEAKAQELKKKIQKADEEAHTARQGEAALQVELNKLAEQLENARRESEKAVRELVECREERAIEGEKRGKHSVKKIVDLQNRERELIKIAQGKDMELGEAAASLARCEAELQHRAEVEKSLKMALAAAEARGTEMRRRSDAVEREVKAARKKIDGLVEEITDMERRLANAEEEKAESSRVLTDRLNTRDAEYREAVSQRADVEARLVSAKAELDEVEKEKENLKRAVAQNAGAVEGEKRAEVELQMAKEQLKELKRQNEIASSHREQEKKEVQSRLQIADKEIQRAREEAEKVMRKSAETERRLAEEVERREKEAVAEARPRGSMDRAQEALQGMRASKQRWEAKLRSAEQNIQTLVRSGERVASEFAVLEPMVHELLYGENRGNVKWFNEQAGAILRELPRFAKTFKEEMANVADLVGGRERRAREKQAMGEEEEAIVPVRQVKDEPPRKKVRLGIGTDDKTKLELRNRARQARAAAAKQRERIETEKRKLK